MTIVPPLATTAAATASLLAEGGTVTGAANAVGYESTSAFVFAFRRALGTTPGRYFKRAAAAEDESEDAPPRPARDRRPGPRL